MSIIWTHHLDNAPKRVNHASAAVDDLIFSFGGYCTGEDYEEKKPIEVHCLNTNILSWCRVQYTHQDNEADVPFNRYGHTVVADGHIVYLWGGRNDESACKILFAFNCYKLTWSRPRVSGLIPLSRDGHSAAIHDRKMYIFGGFEDETQRFSQDVHCLDLRTLTWSQIVTMGSAPAWRDFHTLSCIDHCLFVFGGRSDAEGPYHTRQESYDNRVHMLDLKTLTWKTRQSAAGDPIGRRSHSAFVFQKCLYIFGGFHGAETNLHYNDLFKFDPKHKEWSQVVTKGTCPCPRRRQSCAMIGSKLYLFGGTR